MVAYQPITLAAPSFCPDDAGAWRARNAALLQPQLRDFLHDRLTLNLPTVVQHRLRNEERRNPRDNNHHGNLGYSGREFYEVIKRIMKQLSHARQLLMIVFKELLQYIAIFCVLCTAHVGTQIYMWTFVTN